MGTIMQISRSFLIQVCPCFFWFALQGQESAWFVSVEQVCFLPLFWVTTWWSIFANGKPHFLNQEWLLLWIITFLMLCFHPANQTAGRSPCGTHQREQKFHLGAKKDFFLNQCAAKHLINWKRFCWKVSAQLWCILTPNSQQAWWDANRPKPEGYKLVQS